MKKRGGKILNSAKLIRYLTSETRDLTLVVLFTDRPAPTTGADADGRKLR
jgi:hypothetical protein